MLRVDRANYVLPRAKAMAYEDSPQSISYNATISAPHMHAHVAELLLSHLKPGSSVLDVGSGSGYMLAVFHQLTKTEPKRGHIVGIEHIQGLTDFSVANMRNDGLADELRSKRIAVVTGDGRKGMWRVLPQGTKPWDRTMRSTSARPLRPSLMHWSSSLRARAA